MMAKTIGHTSLKCACGATLTRRNIRASGMAVCRCGNNFTASQFDIVEDLPLHPRGEYAKSRWDADLCDWVIDEENGIYQRIY
jgi:hypothetical protein